MLQLVTSARVLFPVCVFVDNELVMVKKSLYLWRSCCSTSQGTRALDSTDPIFCKSFFLRETSSRAENNNLISDSF